MKATRGAVIEWAATVGAVLRREASSDRSCRAPAIRSSGTCVIKMCIRDRTWNSRFHSDAHILGRKILLDRKPYEIIGVMPRQFEFPLVPGQLNRSELWVPMSFTQAEPVSYTHLDVYKRQE